MGKFIRAILTVFILIGVTVGVFFGLVYMDSVLRPSVVVEESVESLGIENLILRIEDIDNQIKSLEAQQLALSGQISHLKEKRSETIAELNNLLDRIRQISGDAN